MPGKNREVRITIIVVVVVFLIILVASLFAYGTQSDEAVVADEVAVPAVDKKHTDQPGTAGRSAGAYTLNNKLLAAEAYRAAAEAGNAESQFKMGEAYSNGQIVPVDPMAMSWYRKSAEQGFSPAQNRIGVIYQHSADTDRNLVVAYALYSVAATHPVAPSVDAQANKRELAKVLSDQQIRDGDILADKLRDLDDFLRTLDRSAR